MLNKDLMPQNVSANVTPLIVQVDTSGSMSGEPIEEVRKGLTAFSQALKNDEKAVATVRLQVVTYNDDVQTLFNEFLPVNDENFQSFIENINANGSTSMFKAFEKSLNLFTEYKKSLSEQGVNYYRPIYVHLTDGYPTDVSSNERGRWESIRSRLRNSRQSKEFIPFCFATRTADLEFLNWLYPEGHVFLIENNRYDSVFQWLSNSMSAVSRATGRSVTIENPTVYEGITLPIY